MFGREYYASLDAGSITNDSDQDLFEMVMASGYQAQLLAWRVTDTLLTSEKLRLRMVRRSTTGTGGVALTKNPTDPGNTVSSQCTLSALVTTPGTIGAILPCSYEDTIGGFGEEYSEPRMIWIPNGGRLCLNLQSAVGATRTGSIWICWREFG